QNDLRAFFLDQLQEHARGGERLQSLIRLNEDRAIGTHRKTRAQLLLSVLGADRCHDHFGRTAFFLDPQRLFERNLIEGIDAHLDAFGHDAAAVRFDAYTDVVIDDTLQANENLAHEIELRGRLCRGRTL